jgi:hypothetical protein
MSDERQQDRLDAEAIVANLAATRTRLEAAEEVVAAAMREHYPLEQGGGTVCSCGQQVCRLLHTLTKYDKATERTASDG